MTIPDTFAFLLGDWEIDRVIDDRRAGQRSRFRGSARISPSRGTATAGYLETGTLQIAGRVGPARRALSFDPNDGAVLARFADGRPFITIDLRRGDWEARHPCVADDYRLHFTVLDDATIDERWQVSGPEKDYEATTTWRRIAGWAP